MTSGQTLLLLGGGVILYNIFAKTTAGGNLNFYPDGIHSIDIQGISPVIKVYVKIQNTSNQKFAVRSFAGNVFADNQLIGNAENFQGLSVMPNSQIRMLVNLKLNPLSIINRILDAFGGGGLKVKLELDAKANVDGYVVPVPLSYTVG